MANPVVSKNLNWTSETLLHPLDWRMDGLPVTDACSCTARERDEGILIPFAHEPFQFGSERVFPIPCCVAACKQLDQGHRVRWLLWL